MKNMATMQTQWANTTQALRPTWSVTARMPVSGSAKRFADVYADKRAAMSL